MDALDGLLDGPRARRAFLLRMTMAPPWAVQVDDGAPLTVMAVARGRMWLALDDEPGRAGPVRLDPGDVAVVRAPGRYTVADPPDAAPLARILPGARCVTLGGTPLDASLAQGVRTWGNVADGPDVVLVGTYAAAGEVSTRLLDALPAHLVLPAAEGPGVLLGLLEAELARDRAGQTAVLDRLLDLVLIATLRAWWARPGAAVPPWYAAQGDPVVGPALRLLHHNPAAPWTVASLASAVGASRAQLARRFTEQVGEPPMTYLTRWRLAVAADRLAEPGATLSAVAAEVGYATPFALSTAFKRVRGVSPRQHRRQAVVATSA